MNKLSEKQNHRGGSRSFADRCDPFLELASAWIDGELEASELVALQKHIDECEDCRAAVERFRSVNRWVETGEIANDGSASFLPQSPVGGAEGKQSRRRRWRVWALAGTLAASIAVLASVVTKPSRGTKSIAEPVAIPSIDLKPMQAINADIRDSTQDSLETIEIGLRAMRVQARDSIADEAERVRFVAEVEILLARVAMEKNKM